MWTTAVTPEPTISTPSASAEGGATETVREVRLLKITAAANTPIRPRDQTGQRYGKRTDDGVIDVGVDRDAALVAEQRARSDRIVALARRVDHHELAREVDGDGGLGLAVLGDKHVHARLALHTQARKAS